MRKKFLFIIPNMTFPILKAKKETVGFVRSSILQLMSTLQVKLGIESKILDLHRYQFSFTDMNSFQEYEKKLTNILILVAFLLQEMIIVLHQIISFIIWLHSAPIMVGIVI